MTARRDMLRTLHTAVRAQPALAVGRLYDQETGCFCAQGVLYTLCGADPLILSGAWVTWGADIVPPSGIRVDAYDFESSFLEAITDEGHALLGAETMRRLWLVNDGHDREYPQRTAKQRVLRFLTDAIAQDAGHGSGDDVR